MPDYTFEIVIILTRGDTDEISIVRESHSLYSTVLVETVYYIAKPYMLEGYKLHRFYVQNFTFISSPDEPHG